MHQAKLDKVAAVVLAAGKGTRMNSGTPKVLHQILDRPMIFYPLEKLKDLGIKDIYVVVGYQAAKVRQAVAQTNNCHFAMQRHTLGTAHALKQALRLIDSKYQTILVVNGDDSAFYAIDTLNSLITSHQKNKAVMTMMTMEKKEPNHLGRVVRDNKGNFLQILEWLDFQKSGLKTNEANCGAYVFDRMWLQDNINRVPKSSKGEYYITELLNIAKEQNLPINLYPLKNSDEWVGINTPEELELANKLMARIFQKGMPDKRARS